MYVRTVYKSPTSIHVFSFSIEDTDLLPLIPPTPANTIRSDTVIQGWCIEALSPSTTQVTLIEQTNLRGWQTKGLVYQSMINAVASCGEFAIKSGSPPFVNRLLGAQATNSIYNHEKGSLKVEYAAKQEANFNSATSPASAAEVSTSIKAPKQQSFVECEIRCDTDTWASSLDVVVDPPPSRISCLARHRLAAGGGTWLTLEHDSAMIAHVVVAVIVRKGPSSRAKGAVFVNGARVKVDNQAMAEAEIKSLTLEKRMRSSPVPLDQLLSTSRPSSTMASREPTPRTTKPSPLSISDKKLPEDDAPPRSASSIQEKTTIPLAKDSLQPVPPQSLHQPVPPSPHAMSYALEALSLLQALHVEQGPEISAVAPGWSSANERGGIFRRKLFPSLSTTHPIARGDKIVERVTAEQMLSVLTNPSVRPAWDDRVDKASTLQSFGQGQVSTLITTKPAFLTFKGRLLHVAQVPSQITVPSASATASTSTVYLLASASAPLPDGNLSPGAINSQGLPVAKMHFEGWILETLDPYSSSSLPIPSTRTSHFSCIDWSGSIPASFAPLLNASPLRIIDSVAAQARKLSIPRSLAPPDFSQVEGPLSSDEERLCVWHIKDPSLSVHESRFITSDFTLTPSRFRLVVKLPQLENPPIDHSLTKAQIHSRTGSNPFKRQPAASTSHTPNLPRHDSQQSLKDAAAGPSAPSLKSKSSVTSIRHAAAGLSSMATSQQIRNIHDLVVAECLVAYQDFCEAGYEINISSSSLDSSSTSPDEQTTPDFDDDALAATTDLPFRVSVHEMPNLGVASAADQPAKKLHMVRVTLPTSQFTNPVADPLRDAAGRAPPQWFRRLGPSSANVLAAVVVTPLPHEESPLPRGRSDSEVTAPRPVRVLYNGSRVHVATEKDSKSIFERHEKNDWQTAATVISR